LLPAALLFVEIPQYGLQFLDTTLSSTHFLKILVIDAYLLQRGKYTKEELADYDVVFPAELQDEAALLQVQQQVSASYRVLAVLGFSEISVLPAAILADGFGVSGIGTDVARACRNKLKMIEAFNDNGIHCPRFFVTDTGKNVDDQVAALGGYPVICKPLMGFASFGVIKAGTQTELDQAVKRIKRSTRLLLGRYYGLDQTCTAGQVLVQSFIPGMEIAVDGYVYEGESKILAVIDKPDVSHGPYFADAMHITPTNLDAATVYLIKENVQASITAIGLDNSPFHIEARIFDERIYLLELAARVAFVRCLRNSTGIDAMEIMIALRLGEKPDVKPRWLRYSGSYCITPRESGIFSFLANREQILNDPRILDIPIYVEKGQRVAPAPESTGDIAHVLACTETYEDVLEALTLAKSKIRVMVQ
jgi:biotin carboxylase